MENIAVLFSPFYFLPHSNLLMWSLIFLLTLTTAILAVAFSFLVASTMLPLPPPFLNLDLVHNYSHTATSPPPKPLIIPASNPLHKPSLGLHKTYSTLKCLQPYLPSTSNINLRDIFSNLFHLLNYLHFCVCLALFCNQLDFLIES